MAIVTTCSVPSMVVTLKGIQIERHHDGAEALRRAHRRIKARPVITKQRNMCAALQSTRRNRSGKSGSLFRQLEPGYGAPDAAALFTDGGAIATFFRVMQQQFWKCIQARFAKRHLQFSPVTSQPPSRVERASKATTECRNDVANAANACDEFDSHSPSKTQHCTRRDLNTGSPCVCRFVCLICARIFLPLAVAHTRSAPVGVLPPCNIDWGESMQIEFLLSWISSNVCARILSALTT
jgi:hypothetical protein